MLGIDPVVNISTGNASAVNVHQIWTNENVKRFSNCKFKVDSNLYSSELGKHSRGVFISIRKLNLRKNINTNECIDYVRIKVGTVKTQKICGTFNVNDEIGHKSFFNNDGGNVTIFIHIERNTSIPVDGKYLELELLFTAYESKWISFKFQGK